MGAAIEARGESLESAVQAAAESLGMGIDDIEYEVVDEGSRGVLGLGARDVVVRARPRGEETPLRGAAEQAADGAPDAHTGRADASEGPAPGSHEGDQDPERGARRAKRQAEGSPEEALAEPVGDLDDLVDLALDATDEILDGFDADADAEGYADPEGNIVVEITGPDVGGIIGRRGQTLEAIQYLLGRVVSRTAGRRIRVLVDAEGYRARRREALEELAHRTARKVAQTRHATALRPMGPAERRVIHIALSEDPAVETRSEGEEPDRKVVIEPR